MIKPRVIPKIKTVPVLKLVARGTIAAELWRTCGASDTLVEVINAGVQRSLVKEVFVFGLNAKGKAVERFKVAFSLDGDGEMMVEDNDRSMLGKVDGGLERMVMVFAGRLQQKKLKPMFYCIFHDHIVADADKLTRARRELGLAPCEEPDWADGRPVEVLSLKTAKDPGTIASMSAVLRRKGSRS